MILKKAIRLFYTVKYLKFTQIAYRLRYKLAQGIIDNITELQTRSLADTWKNPIQKKSHLSKPWTFTFLEQKYNCQFPQDWNSDQLEKLWLYNLHYFDDLQSSKCAERKDMHVDLIHKWIDENPIGIGNGWEPYPTSLRIVNWIKWAYAVNPVTDAFTLSLAIQTRNLEKKLEYHLLGNHLFANAKALIFAGLYFEGKEADDWFNLGMHILKREVPEQILPDGGHFERSPMYHGIILEDMLDMVNLCQTYGKEYPPAWDEKINKMLCWLNNMLHPDGQISLFNDAALNIAAAPNELRLYATRIRFEDPLAPSSGTTTMEPSGYIRWQSNSAMLLMDVGEIGPSYLPGHAHADTLSFEMSIYGQRVIVDTGTSCYGLSAERLRQRKTISHNTVYVDQEDSSEVWGGFRVARRAKPFDLRVAETINNTKISCKHDGYKRLPGKVKHHREWILAENQATIIDNLSGSFTKAVASLHLHPEVQINKVQSNIYELTLIDGNTCRIAVKNGNCSLVKTTYHPGFGIVESTNCLRISFTTNSCETVITWQ